MSRAIKERMVRQYAARFRGVADLAVVSTQGIDVQRMTALRRSLRAKGIRAMVVHNRLCKVALKEAGLQAAEELLRGPTTLVWGGETIVDIAKVLTEEAGKLKELQIRGGLSSGKRLTKEDIEALSTLPGRLELLGMVIGRVLGQARRVAGLLAGVAGRIVAQVRQVEKRSAAPEAEAPKAEGAAPAAEEAKAEGAAPASEGAKAEGAPPAAEGAKAEGAAPASEGAKAEGAPPASEAPPAEPPKA